MVKDPVCGITLDTMAPFKSAHAGQIQAFCCPACKTEFDKAPGRYVVLAGATSVTRRSPSQPPTSRRAVSSSIGHLLDVVLGRSESDQTQGRST
jgi:YHS domain-containing protein